MLIALCAFCAFGCTAPKQSDEDASRHPTLCIRCQARIAPYITSCPFCGASDPTGYYDVAGRASSPAEFTTEADRETAREKQREKIREELRRLYSEDE